VLELADGQPVSFREIGAVELKGISGVVRLHQATWHA